MTEKPVHEEETDHEFRLRMAREGKALYTPGRPIEQVKAELEAERSRKVTLTMTAHQAELFHRATFDVAVAALQAESALMFLGKVVADGDYAGDVGVGDLLQLIARGLGSFDERGDTEALQKLSRLIKKAGGLA